MAAAERSLSDPTWDLHEAAYYGRLDVVKRLLSEGSDPNAEHASSATGWVCGRSALNKAIVAKVVSENHVAIVALLIDHGARVDESHFEDWNADATGSAADQDILQLLRKARPDL